MRGWRQSRADEPGQVPSMGQRNRLPYLRGQPAGRTWLEGYCAHTGRGNPDLPTATPVYPRLDADQAREESRGMIESSAAMQKTAAGARQLLSQWRWGASPEDRRKRPPRRVTRPAGTRGPERV